MTVTLPSSVASGGPLVLNISYSLPVESNTGLAAISPIGSQFLPLSFWYPAPNTPFTVRGADTAPFRLTVNGPNVISLGSREKQRPAQLFTSKRSMRSRFLFRASGTRLRAPATAKTSRRFCPRRYAEEKKQAEAIIDVWPPMRALFTRACLGPAPDVPIRLVSVRRGAGFNEGGTILLEAGAFRRAKVDSTHGFADCRSSCASVDWWTNCGRGEGGGVLRDGLTRFLATLFIEKQFGREAAAAELLRQRLAYSTVAKRDAPLSRVTPLDATYSVRCPTGARWFGDWSTDARS